MTGTGTGVHPGSEARGSLLVADRVITLGHGRYRARAVLVRGSRVVWVGDDPADAPPAGEVVDLSGSVIGPGFVDSHAHLTPTGLALLGLDLSDARSGSELLRAVATYAAQHTGRVVWGHGYDPHGFPDELPDPAQLAEVADGRAVYLSRVDGHSALVDRSTLAAAPLARAAGMELDASGEPTGLLRREANHIARRWSVGAMDAGELQRAREAAAAHAAAHGIVCVHEMGGPDLMGAEDLDAWRDGRWPIEVVPYWAGLDLGFASERDLRQIGGDLLLDGSLGSHTAALGAPYADANSSGQLELDDATLVEFLREATEAGVQVGVHAIGDAAIRQAVRCWRTVEDELPGHLKADVRRSRHRLEHAEVIPPELYTAIAELGLVVSAQPVFEAYWGGESGLYERRLGSERRSWTNPFRPLADHGVPLAFGSDSNVTPMDPWEWIHAAQHHPDERYAVTRLEGVSASTLGGRHATRQERYVGVVRAGMRADLSVWEGDPYAADDPRGSRCVRTIREGRVIHED